MPKCNDGHNAKLQRSADSLDPYVNTKWIKLHWNDRDIKTNSKSCKPEFYLFVTGAQQPEGQELLPLQWIGAQENCRRAASG